MKSKILHLLLLPPILALVLTDCAAQPASDTDKATLGIAAFAEWQPGTSPDFKSIRPCNGRPIRGISIVHVIYGDASLNVTARAQVGKHINEKVGVGAIEFRLNPSNSSGPFKETAVVTIIGTEGRDAEGNEVDASWLAALGRGRTSLFVCPDIDTPIGSYKYEVRVQGVGTLDPRAEVIE